MAGLVSAHQIAAFSDPQNGQDGDATVVLGNDNSIVTAYDAHDADGTIHVQSSTLALRSAAATAGRKWVTVDSSAVRFFYDTGSAWLELNTFGAAVTFSAAITYGGVTLSNAVTGTGNMVLSASPTFTGTVITAALTGTVVTASTRLIADEIQALSGGTNFIIENNGGTDLVTINKSSGAVAFIAGLSGITTLATSGTYTASGLIQANAGVTVASGQTLTVTGATITGLTAASVGAGTFPSGAYVFQGALSGITTLAGTGAISGFTSLAISAGISGVTTIVTSGKITCGGELELDGAFNHDGTTIGFFGTTPTTIQTVDQSGGATVQQQIDSIAAALAAYGFVNRVQ